MNISGILVHVQPERIDEIREKLGKLPGVEVHMNSEEGQVVVTAEEPGKHPRGETFMDITNMEGVMSAMLTYHQILEEEEL